MNNENLTDLDLIERFLEGSLNDTEKNAFRRRLEDDPAFAGYVRLRTDLPEHWRRANLYQETRQEVRRAIQPPAHRGVFHLNRTTWAIAASLIILLGVALALVLSDRTGHGTDQMAGTGDSMLIPTVDQAIDKARVEEVYPEGSGEIIRIEMVSPEQNATFRVGESIVFSWNKPDSQQLEISVFEVSTGKIVYSHAVDPGVCSDTLRQVSLQPGRYFWHLGNASDKRSFIIINP